MNIRNEEDAATVALEDHIRMYGVSDLRLAARASLAAVSLHQTRKATENYAAQKEAVEAAEKAAADEAAALKAQQEADEAAIAAQEIDHG